MSVEEPEIVVLGGGTSPEREVSLRSSRAVHEALSGRLAARWLDLTADTLPEGLDPARQVIFPVLHGGFGENGGLQAQLEAGGFDYVGCDAAASERCMDKRRSKEAAQSKSVPTAPALYYERGSVPTMESVEARFGDWRVVVKPMDEGSSVGLHFADSRESLAAVFALTSTGRWMIEPRLEGYDVTVGVLNGHPLGVVEILPIDGGAYDYEHKYTAGKTEYRFPAALPEPLVEELRAAATAVFQGCGCRDFARVDFFLGPLGFSFLEINTIPGLTATSLLPKSAQCMGYDFPGLVEAMVRPALDRFHLRHRRLSR